jgi:hypothetical protein
MLDENLKNTVFCAFGGYGYSFGEEKIRNVVVIIPNFYSYFEGVIEKIKEMVEKYQPEEVTIVCQGKAMFDGHRGKFELKLKWLYDNLDKINKRHEDVVQYLKEKNIKLNEC